MGLSSDHIYIATNKLQICARAKLTCLSCKIVSLAVAGDPSGAGGAIQEAVFGFVVGV